MPYWKQGQHVAVVGNTGSGKSYLTARLLPARGHVLVLKTKPDDIRYPGFARIKRIGQLRSTQTRYVLDPGPDLLTQARECARALRYCWDASDGAGGWCVSVDELYYTTQRLRLGSFIEQMATQGRSKQLSLVIGVQRPVGVTRWALSEATHVICFRLEGRDVKTIAEATTPRIEPVMAALRRYEAAYYNRVTGEVGTVEAHRLSSVIWNVPQAS